MWRRLAVAIADPDGIGIAPGQQQVAEQIDIPTTDMQQPGAAENFENAGRQRMGHAGNRSSCERQTRLVRQGRQKRAADLQAGD
jgi:hypothetical protein